MKKQLSTAMAAAMAFGTVVPAFAATTTTTTESNITVTTTTANTRLANGLELVTTDSTIGDKKGQDVYFRSDVFNYNGSPEDREKHTLKNELQKEGCEVLYIQKDSSNPANDLVVLGKKSTNSVDVIAEKAAVDAMKTQMEELQKQGYAIVDSETGSVASTINTNGKYVAGYQKVTLIKGTDKRVFEFTNSDSATAAEDEATALRKEVIEPLAIANTANVANTNTSNEEITIKFSQKANNEDDYSNASDAYAATNQLKFAIENNKEKFDIIVDETGNTNNKGIVVKLYVKATDYLVTTLTFNDVANIDPDKIVNMPIISKSDFNGHWAQETITKAMLNGWVDASETFRAKDSITRAEFAKILCTVLNVPVEDANGNSFEEPFHDVNPTDWYHKYVAALYNAGIVKGYEDMTFKPKEDITRQEAARMIADAFAIMGANNTEIAKRLQTSEGYYYVETLSTNGKTSLTTTSTITKVESSTIVNKQEIDLDITTKFADDAEIKAWADASVEALRRTGVIKGYEGNKFNPTGKITRAEALIMVTGDNQN